MGALKVQNWTLTHRIMTERYRTMTYRKLTVDRQIKDNTKWYKTWRRTAKKWRQDWVV